MKITFLVIATILLIGAGCLSTTPAPEPPHQGVDVSANYGQNVTLEIDDTATYNDDLTVHLKAINDSRCPPDVACIWAGELSATLEMKTSDGTSEETTVGTLTKPSTTVLGYEVQLVTITETSATIVVNNLP